MKNYTQNLMKPLIFLLLLFVIGGCGKNSGTAADNGTGSIAAKLVWMDSAKTAGKSVGLAPAGVLTVRFTVSGPGITSPITTDFVASTGAGLLTGVPAGVGRTITAQALDGPNGTGNVIYAGTASPSSVTVVAGQTASTVTITMWAIANIAAPSALVATAASAGQVNLSWADNSSNETGFKIERKTGATGAYSQIGTALANATTYSDTGLTLSGTYYYQVRATNAAGDSLYSNEASVIIAPTLVSIAVTPANPGLTVGATQQFTATGMYSDATTRDLTALVTWSSSFTSYATIATNGVATAVAVGSSAIIATSGAVTGVTPLTVSAASVAKGVISLPKTGQTTCYDAAGAIIACTGTGQDGALQIGAAWPNPRFTDNANGTVTDNLTGLIWLKNANCFSSQVWSTALTSANTLASGACGLSDSSIAGQWRLPNRKELQSLVDRSQYNPALPLNHPFTSVQSNNFWSSSSYSYSTSHAWLVSMFDGYVYNYNKSGYNNFVWPVRAGQ